MFRLVILVATLLVASCSTVPDDVISSGERYTIAGGTGTGAQGEYELGPNDRVRMTVFNEPTLSGEFAVGSDGLLSLPLIGDVSASGRTAARVAELVRERLADGYLRDPRVSMEVITFRPFFILGEVESPGQYPYVNGLTVLNAIATAQGFTPRAQRMVAYIRTAGEAGERAYSVSPDLRVYPGDTIRIGERFF